MKKSLLALAVVLAATSATASAATVYDKDGTTLTVGGRVQSVFYNGFYKKAGYKDASLVNSSRFSVAGNTKVNNYLSVLAFSEWDMADGNKPLILTINIPKARRREPAPKQGEPVPVG